MISSDAAVGNVFSWLLSATATTTATTVVMKDVIAYVTNVIVNRANITASLHPKDSDVHATRDTVLQKIVVRVRISTNALKTIRTIALITA